MKLAWPRRAWLTDERRAHARQRCRPCHVRSKRRIRATTPADPRATVPATRSPLRPAVMGAGKWQLRFLQPCSWRKANAPLRSAQSHRPGCCRSRLKISRDLEKELLKLKQQLENSFPKISERNSDSEATTRRFRVSVAMRCRRAMPVVIAVRKNGKAAIVFRSWPQRAAASGLKTVKPRSACVWPFVVMVAFYSGSHSIGVQSSSSSPDLDPNYPCLAGSLIPREK